MTVPPDKSPDAISGAKVPEPIGPSVTHQPPSSFETYMQGTAATPSGAPPGTAGAPPSGPTPMEAARPPAISTTGIDVNSLQMQAKNTQDSLGTVEKQLNEQNLKLKRSQTHLVRQKLDDANGYIRAAGSMMGAQVTEQKLPPGATGISRFIAMVNDGQDQLVQVQQKLSELSAKGGQMNPGEMMAIQVKMGLAQQEIEYTSTLLSKVIQSITQIINTQL